MSERRKVMSAWNLLKYYVRTTGSEERVLATHEYFVFRDEYDWYFLATDDTYLEPDRIQYLVDHISINRRLYLGKPTTYTDKTGEITYCNVSVTIIFYNVAIRLCHLLFTAFSRKSQIGKKGDSLTSLGYLVTRQYWQTAVEIVLIFLLPPKIVKADFLCYLVVGVKPVVERKIHLV